MSSKDHHGGLISFEPKFRLNENGFTYVSWQNRIYPPFLSPDTMQTLAANWDTDENDIFICSHQKTGTHLTKKFCIEILRSVINYPNYHPLSTGDIGHHSIPWPEVMASQYGLEHFKKFLDTTKGFPRIWYSHCSKDDFPFRSIHPKTKFIYVYRDPRGTMVSQYFFYRSHPMLDVNAELSLDFFLDLFIDGPIYFGDYHHHVIDWIEGCRGRIKKDQLQLITYESLVDEKQKAAEQLSDFLFGRKLLTAEAIQSVIASTEFATMKKEMIDHPQSFHFNPEKFFREGKSTGWKRVLSDEQVQRINIKSEKVWGKNHLSNPLLIDIDLSNTQFDVI